MSRNAYLILFGVLILLLVALFWPEEGADDAPRVWRGEAPSRYELRSAGRTGCC